MIKQISITFPANFPDDSQSGESREIPMQEIELSPEETEQSVVFGAIESHLDIAAGSLSQANMILQISIQTNTIMVFPPPVFGNE